METRAQSVGRLAVLGGTLVVALAAVVARGGVLEAPEPSAAEVDRTRDLRLLRAGRLLALDAQVALADGDLDRSVDRVEELGALVRVLESASGLVRQMFAASTEGRQLQAVEALVASPSVDREHLDRLSGALSDLDTPAALRRMMEVEAGEYLAMVEEVRAQNPDEDPAREADAEILAAYRALAATPFSEVRRRLDQRMRAAASAETPEDVIVGLAIPNMIEAVVKIQAAGAGRQLARIALELRRRHLDGGSYPADLGGVPGAGEPDPYAGERPRWEPGPEGGTLSNPAAAALWGTAARRHGPPFVWRLPA